MTRLSGHRRHPGRWVKQTHTRIGTTHGRRLSRNANSLSRSSPQRAPMPHRTSHDRLIAPLRVFIEGLFTMGRNQLMRWNARSCGQPPICARQGQVGPLRRNDAGVRTEVVVRDSGRGQRQRPRQQTAAVAVTLPSAPAFWAAVTLWRPGGLLMRVGSIAHGNGYGPCPGRCRCSGTCPHRRPSGPPGRIGVPATQRRTIGVVARGRRGGLRPRRWCAGGLPLSRER